MRQLNWTKINIDKLKLYHTCYGFEAEKIMPNGGYIYVDDNGNKWVRHYISGIGSGMIHKIYKLR